MNTLSFRTSTENGLSFELLVDGEPLATLIRSQGSEIPYWLIDDDLPYFPPCGADRDKSKRIVTVCDCGEYGCGHTHCKLVATEHTVELLDFDVDVGLEGSRKHFLFPLENYQEVIREIVRLAKAHALQEAAE